MSDSEDSVGTSSGSGSEGESSGSDFEGVKREETPQERKKRRKQKRRAMRQGRRKRNRLRKQKRAERKAKRAARKKRNEARRARRKRRRARAKYGKNHRLHKRAYHKAENVYGCLAGLDIHLEEMKSVEETPHWTYKGAHGPGHWASMGFPAANGKEQSPININPGDSADIKLPNLDIDYEEEDASIINNGHTIQVNWPAGDIQIADKKFELLQFHFHSPSEHTLNGKHYPLEMHMVHKSEDNQLAVIAVMFEKKAGEHNEFLDQFWEFLPETETVEGALPEDLDEIDIDDLDLSEKKYYRYMGSLTTPPCSEQVVWTVMSEVATCSPAQVQHFKRCLGVKNNRPVQPLHARQVTC